MALCARKYDVSENLNHYASNRIKCYVRENLPTRKCQIGLDARKYSSAKISTFTVDLFKGLGNGAFKIQER